MRLILRKPKTCVSTKMFVLLLTFLLCFQTLVFSEGVGEKARNYCKDIYGKTTLDSGSYVTDEFSHLAILGLDKEGEVSWVCGGVLVSKNYVLAAAHCARNREGGIKHVRLGDNYLKSKKINADPQNFTIIKTIVHPDYKPPSRYNDIALLQLDKDARISQYVSPACLQSKLELPTSEWITAGWGLLNSLSGIKSEPQAKSLAFKEVKSAECNNSFHIDRHLKNGIDDNLLVCAINPKGDSCQIESGNPLQIKNLEYPTGHEVFGIVSFGKSCLIAEAPTVYTRIFPYLEWIESTVWPN